MRKVEMSRTSIVTINKDRDFHLSKLLEGLGRGEAPDEIIVVEVGVNGEPRVRGDVVHVPLPGNNLPLAQARNTGRRAASGDILIFLDVDCIPSRDLVSTIKESVATHDGLICCEVFYLKAAVPDEWDEADLLASSVPHPARRFPTTGVSAAPQPGLFWSLAFAVSARTYDRIGGFDEAFSGYGAEDTDLGFAPPS